ncbi:hypothetical protein AHF37_09100 [Paragonimus kellicotti]|nr:hypothetical protein AHF37_09100 [Paragonimus kellicotti]
MQLDSDTRPSPTFVNRHLFTPNLQHTTSDDGINCLWKPTQTHQSIEEVHCASWTTVTQEKPDLFTPNIENTDEICEGNYEGTGLHESKTSGALHRLSTCQILPSSSYHPSARQRKEPVVFELPNTDLKTSGETVLSVTLGPDCDVMRGSTSESVHTGRNEPVSSCFASSTETEPSIMHLGTTNFSDFSLYSQPSLPVNICWNVSSSQSIQNSQQAYLQLPPEDSVEELLSTDKPYTTQQNTDSSQDVWDRSADQRWMQLDSDTRPSPTFVNRHLFTPNLQHTTSDDGINCLWKPTQTHQSIEEVHCASWTTVTQEKPDLFTPNIENTDEICEGNYEGTGLHESKTSGALHRLSSQTSNSNKASSTQLSFSMSDIAEQLLSSFSPTAQGTSCIRVAKYRFKNQWRDSSIRNIGSRL